MSEDQKQQEQGEEPGFSVKDRRRFTGEGEERDDVIEEPAAGGEPIIGESRGQPQPMPEMDFSTFVLSLSQSAMIHMGETELPGGIMKKDLVLAKQSIDILDMLEQKTKGNLTAEEQELLREMLYSIRMAFVKAMG